MTQPIRTTARIVLFLLTAAIAGSSQEVSMITSNTVYDVAGSGDTAWFLTDAGVNYTIAQSNTLTWWGYTSRNFYSHDVLNGRDIFYGSGHALALVLPSDQTKYNQFWVYDHTAKKVTTYSLPWTFHGVVDDSMDLNCYDAVSIGTSWWLACMDGGLVQWNFSTSAGRTWYPGIPHSIGVSSFPDTAVSPRWRSRLGRVMSIAGFTGANGARIAVVTPHTVWIYSLSDSSWDSLPSTFSPQPSSFEFQSVYANRTTSPAVLYAAVGTPSDTSLYRFDSAAGAWTRFYKTTSDEQGAPRNARRAAFGAHGLVYVTDAKNLFAYRDSAGTALLPLGAPTLTAKQFSDRIAPAAKDNDVDLLHFTVYSVAALTNPGNSLDTAVRFWIATNQGIFFTRNETAAEAGDSSLLFVKRAPKVDAGLKSSYAFPGILTVSGMTDAAPKTTFAYNLSSDARVTIRIYDWNMDLVRTVIDKQLRHAGSSRQSGRSSELSDTWDGTNRDGVVVAPGVYYYVISTDTGIQSRGKIVVALSR